MSSPVTYEALLEAARQQIRPGISSTIAIVLAWAELAGQPLDAEDRDDAAVILRAERLLLDDVPVAEAVQTARAELATFADANDRLLCSRHKRDLLHAPENEDQHPDAAGLDHDQGIDHDRNLLDAAGDDPRGRA